MDCIKNVVKGTADGQEEDLLLLLDLSGSMDEEDWKPSRLQGAKDACLALLEEKLRQWPQDRVGIVSFADGARLEEELLPVASGMTSLRDAVRKLSTYGRTDIGAGLEECERAFGSRTSIRQQVREKGLLAWILAPELKPPVPSCQEGGGRVRRILLLSDGDHNGATRPRPVSVRLKNSGVEINCIGIGGTKSDVYEALLQKIASADSSGKPKYWYIGDRIQLIRTFERLAGGLRSVGS